MLVDLSHTIEHGMMTYPGLPGPLICDYLSREASRAKYAPGVEFQIGKIDMVANTGTYLDSPFHRYADGNDLAALPLERLAGLDAVVVRIGPDAPRAIGWAAFERLDEPGLDTLGEGSHFLDGDNLTNCENLPDAGGASANLQGT